ncbi:MAG: ATP-binding cassette domain-containing protein [Smithellaceae bacterium]|nr:ATP-binding cassette domain-containing protein [Smithellaceae bacterium]
METLAAIEAENLHKIYGRLVAVDGLSFSVRRGECFGILGPNGAGKTTTIRMIYGFSPMTKGRLRVFGLTVPDELRDIKARLGVCQQENTLDPDLSTLENLIVFARYFNIPKTSAQERAARLLQFMALDHRREARANELSGGMVRRLIIARALINDPQLLILDEPTTGLDPQSRHQVWEQLEKLKAEGLSILLTTHYMDEAARLCDRLIIMDHGRMLVEGGPTDLIKSYIGRDVIEVGEPPAELVEYVRGRGLSYDNLASRLIVYSNGEEGLYHKISQEFCKSECVLRMATLEDVFLKLTGRELRE